MALTNSDARKVKESPVTDMNSNVAIHGQRRQISHEAAVLFNPAIVAKPLNTPEVCSLHVKHTEYAYRWVNKLAKGGWVYMQRRAQGFTNATLDDVDILTADVTATDSEITAFDVVLMKIPAERYDAALKFNAQKALALTRSRGVYMEGASSDVFSDDKARRVSVSNEPYSKSGQAAPFIPDNPDALVEDSLRSGRSEDTRRVVEELRTKGAKGEK